MRITPNSTLLTASLATLGLSSLVAFSGLRADKVAFTPAEGATVTKTFVSNTVMEVDDMSALMNGEEGPFPEISMTMDMSQTITITDEYGAVADGQPAKLTRTFDAIGTELEMEVDAGMGEAQSPSGSGSSPLEGSTVVFSWDTDAGEYSTAFAEGEEGDADLLEGLQEDMDLRGLLPQDELAEGDSYEIDITAFADILAPGGDLKIEMEIEGEGADQAGMDPEMMTDFRKFFEDLLEGEATGKYMGVKEVDGVKVGVIELTIEINSSADMADMAAEGMGEEMPEGMEMNIDRMDVEMIYEGAGELHWNMDKGVVHALDLKAELSMNMEMEMAMSFGGQDMEISMEMAMSGSVESAVTTE